MVSFQNPTPHQDTHQVAGILWDRRVIAKSKAWYVVDSQSSIGINITLPDLKYIQTVLNIEFYTDPDAWVYYTYRDKKIHGNVVGFTLYAVSQGTTLTVEAVAIGPP